MAETAGFDDKRVLNVAKVLVGFCLWWYRMSVHVLPMSTRVHWFIS